MTELERFKHDIDQQIIALEGYLLGKGQTQAVRELMFQKQRFDQIMNEQIQGEQ